MTPKKGLIDGYIGKYQFTFNLRDNIQRSIFIGFYEPIHTRKVRKILKRGDTFLDIGANVGYFSLISAQILEEGSIHAFEPIKENYDVLNKAIFRNNIANIFANMVAVGSHNGTVKLYSGKADELGNSGWSSSVPGEGRNQEVDLPLITIDDYVKNADIQKIRLIKIDVEGMELQVLSGMSSILQQSDSPDILIEIFPDQFQQVFQKLDDMGYYVFSLSSNQLIRGNNKKDNSINYFCTKKPDEVIPASRGINWFTRLFE